MAHCCRARSVAAGHLAARRRAAKVAPRLRLQGVRAAKASWGRQGTLTPLLAVLALLTASNAARRRRMGAVAGAGGQAGQSGPVHRCSAPPAATPPRRAQGRPLARRARRRPGRPWCTRGQGTAGPALGCGGGRRVQVQQPRVTVAWREPAPWLCAQRAPDATCISYSSTESFVGGGGAARGAALRQPARSHSTTCGSG